MPASAELTEEEDKRQFPHQHGIPTIAKFREEKEARQAKAQNYTASDGNRRQNASGAKNDTGKEQGGQEMAGLAGENHQSSQTHESKQQSSETDDGDADGLEDTSETVLQTSNPKQQRRQLQKSRDERAERQVTDPVTHLPITIQDLTSDALEDVPENEPAFGSTTRTSTGRNNRDKSSETLQEEHTQSQQTYDSSKSLFPLPERDVVRKEVIAANTRGLTVGFVGTLIILASAVGTVQSSGPQRLLQAILPVRIAEQYSRATIGVFSAALASSSMMLLFKGVSQWMRKRISSIWEEEVWEAGRQEESQTAKGSETETTAWLNSLLSSVWPLVNPDLFLSLADTLEDVMQASLPKFVQMVSVNDIGQGSEAIRILGVKWLPSGAAARSVGKDGSLIKPNAEPKQSNGESPEEKQKSDPTDADNDRNSQQKDDGTQQEVPGGMEAEEGDFVNMEIAFAYRARAARTTLRDRAKNMHLHMAFYLPGNIMIPVWVDLRGIVGTMRLRLQLCPDPPFFSLCTLTFLGQPKVDLGCTPLSKHALNIMDVPFISNFVQTAVDAAMAEYVAPKSLNLDLKDMLEGDDFKKDTQAHGILVVRINRGYDFKRGDTGVPLVKNSSSDPYVSVGWAKFGKPVWSTRIMLDEMEPVWNETAYLLVTPEELNVAERLRVQLWDSDRLTADDDLGRIEVDLKEIMHAPESKGQMNHRTDGFRALKAGDGMPGKLKWSVGYYSKAPIQDCQLQKQTFDPEVRTREQLKEKVDRICDRKLREAQIKEGRHTRDMDELEQLKGEELKSRENAMMISAVPPEGYPSGIFSIQIHQITGLELQRLDNKYDDKKAEEGEGLPSAYCDVVINHKKVFCTRTKPKNSQPFYNAGTERFIGDWRTTEVFVSVRDARVSEDDPLLGIVHLSLADLFRERSQINGFFPITGGVGFGRIRLSMVWRSVQLQAPLEAIGWDYGTITVQNPVSMKDVPAELQSLHLKFHTDIGKGRMHSTKGDEGWSSRKGDTLNLPVSARYASCMTVQFRQHGVLKDKTAAFAVLWLRDIPDDEARDITLTVWKGDFERARKCSLDECGEKVGSITLKTTFWSGLGAAHSRWASKNPDLQDVVEILDTARDNLEHMENEKEAGIVDGDMTSSSNDDSSSDEEADKKKSTDRDRAQAPKGRQERPDGVQESVKERMKHEKSLNRRNRGLMQWRISRKAQWAIHKLENTGEKFPELFKHHAREADVETEV